jgi:DNA invertase Pin-like site-specific DNA recombinase/transposase-like protein
VRHNRESTERQYALQEKASDLGWPQELIQVIDEDLGVSGSGRSQRQGFQTLVTKVSFGEVGAIFGLEVSRLARSSADLSRLLELCALFDTIVADEDGIYDLTDFNDRLILGFKGQMSQVELHYLHSRMLGGKKNKAQKGELRFPLPVGYVYDSDKKTVIDPDEEVQTAVRNVFAVFKTGGSAYSVVKYFTQNGLQFPKRAYGGAWSGKLIWGKLTHGRVMGILYNPSYAGMYVYGRYRDNKTATPDGIYMHHVVRLPRDQWPICIPDHHEGYITEETYEANLKQLHKNRTNAEISGAAREGAALLQGLVICGKCGRRMSIRYTGNGGISPKYECKRRWEHRDKSVCTSVPAPSIDATVSQKLIQAIQPANLELAIQVMEKLLNQESNAQKSWMLAIERAKYDADRAERQYQQVEPENRLVARSLESRWNEKLSALNQLEDDYKQYKANHSWQPTEDDNAMILSLSRELPQIWDSPTTTAKDKKRILRTLIEDVTIFAEARQAGVRLGLRWRNQYLEEIHITKPLPPNTARKHTPETVALIRDLALTMKDSQIVSHLKSSNIKTSEGRAFTIAGVKWIRYLHNIPPFTTEKKGLTVKEMAAKFGVGTSTVYYWIEHGIVSANKTAPRNAYDIELDDRKCAELISLVQNSKHLKCSSFSPQDN